MASFSGACTRNFNRHTAGVTARWSKPSMICWSPSVFVCLKQIVTSSAVTSSGSRCRMVWKVEHLWNEPGRMRTLWSHRYVQTKPRAWEQLIVTHVQGELFEVSSKSTSAAPYLQNQIPGDSDHPRTSFKNDIRVCFAVSPTSHPSYSQLTRLQWEDEDALIEGIERLATVIKTMQHEQNTTGSYKIRLQVEQEAQNFW